MEQGEWLYHVSKVRYIDTIGDLPGWAFWLVMFGLMLGMWMLLWWTKRRHPGGGRRETSPGLRCGVCGGPLQSGAIYIYGERYIARHCPRCDTIEEKS